MPTQELDQKHASLEDRIFAAISAKNNSLVEQIINENPKINLNCLDKDELTPLQHACHNGDLILASLLIDHGAGVNFTNRKDGYTPLMFAAISARANIVKLLLERGVDLNVENCVHRTAAQMAAFVGHSKIVSIINNWIPYRVSIEPYTRPRELEQAPRIACPSLGKLLHEYIVYPSLHPVRLILFIRDNSKLLDSVQQMKYVLEDLSSKYSRPPLNEESMSLKYHYHSYLLDACHKTLEGHTQNESDPSKKDSTSRVKGLDGLIRRLIRREHPDDIITYTKQLDHFIIDCIMKFPYTNSAIFKTMAFALSKRESNEISALAILTQTLNGPRMFGQMEESCAVCGEVYKARKCSRCKSIYYCDQLCQMADWFQHKKKCQEFKATE